MILHQDCATAECASWVGNFTEKQKVSRSAEFDTFGTYRKYDMKFTQKLLMFLAAFSSALFMSCTVTSDGEHRTYSFNPTAEQIGVATAIIVESAK